MTVTLKERFISTMKFKPADRPWRWETLGFWNETIARWHGEGLPTAFDISEKLFGLNEFDCQTPVHFQPDLHPGLFPLFDEEILDESENTIKKISITGAVVEVPKDGHSIPPHILEGPVRDRASWEDMKVRLAPDTPGRVNQHEWIFPLATEHGFPMFVYICGIFGTLRHLFGVEPLMYAFYDQPELIHDIARNWVAMWKSVLAKIAGTYVPDMVNLWEDMCGRSGPLISPAMFETFMSPYYRELVTFMRNELGVTAVSADSDGDITLLIPKFVDAGVNMLYPFEVQAGMDVLKVRKEWPDQFVIWGGIDKRELAKDKAAIEKEVMKIVPPMLKAGGYIPGLDHLVHPEVPYENWLYFRDLTREVVDRYFGL